MVRTLRLAYLFGGIPIVGILILSVIFTEPLLQLLYDDAYLFMSSGIIWLVLFYFLWFTYWPIQSALKAIKQTRRLFDESFEMSYEDFIGCFLAAQHLAIQTDDFKETIRKVHQEHTPRSED